MDDFAAQADTRPVHLRPRPEEPADELYRLADSIRHGRALTHEEVSKALRRALAVLLGGSPEEEALVRVSAFPTPNSAS